MTETEALRRELELGRLDPAFREGFAKAILAMEAEAGGHLNTVGVSPEAAILGLLHLRDFIREVISRGWYLCTDPD